MSASGAACRARRQGNVQWGFGQASCSPKSLNRRNNWISPDWAMLATARRFSPRISFCVRRRRPSSGRTAADACVVGMDRAVHAEPGRSYARMRILSNSSCALMNGRKLSRPPSLFMPPARCVPDRFVVPAEDSCATIGWQVSVCCRPASPVAIVHVAQHAAGDFESTAWSIILSKLRQAAARSTSNLRPASSSRNEYDNYKTCCTASCLWRPPEARILYCRNPSAAGSAADLSVRLA